MAKNTDPNDVPLNKGNAYFVNEGAFRDFLEIHDDSSSQVRDRNFRLLTCGLFILFQGLDMFKTQGSPTTTNDQVCKYAIQWGYGGSMCPA